MAFEGPVADIDVRLQILRAARGVGRGVAYAVEGEGDAVDVVADDAVLHGHVPVGTGVVAVVVGVAYPHIIVADATGIFGDGAHAFLGVLIGHCGLSVGEIQAVGIGDIAAVGAVLPQVHGERGRDDERQSARSRGCPCAACSRWRS